VTLAKVWLRRPDGTVSGFDNLEDARAAAVEGDVIAKAHQGGHQEFEIVLPGPEFVPQPRGWRPVRVERAIRGK